MTTLPPSCAVVMKSGNLNFLEPSGPLQACKGTALPLYIIIRILIHFSLCAPNFMLPACRPHFSEAARPHPGPVHSQSAMAATRNIQHNSMPCPPTPVLICTSTILHYKLTANGKKLEAEIVSMNATEAYPVVQAQLH
jgi:hypothetical protein